VKGRKEEYSFMEERRSKYAWYSGYDGNKNIALIEWYDFEEKRRKRKLMYNSSGRRWYLQLQPLVGWDDMFQGRGMNIDPKDITKL
jgi:hypothetical protein